MKRSAILGAVGLAISALSSCAEKEKEHLPVVAKIGDEVKALSLAEAETICQAHECEPNQIYYASFGKKKRNNPPPPVSTPIKEPPTEPGPTPTTTPPVTGQPAETLDYSRTVLNMNAAWSITEGSAQVIVAVVDSGVAYTHPDLRDNIWTNEVEKNGVKGVDDDGNGFVDDVYGWDFYNGRPNGWDDGSGHGTHCAGIIGAAKNGIGVRGVSPKVKIMPLKFLGKSGSGSTADAINAIRYAIKMGARIISNSWGGGGYSKLLGDAISEARAQGILVVAAAGNNSVNTDSSPHYPAGYPGVIAVGSSDSSDRMSSFSNYGDQTVYVMAPGSSIRSTYLNDSYASISGTSMAAPQVSGALALALALRPGLAESAIREDLCDSAVKKLTTYSVCGRMDVGAFVQRVSTR